MKRSELLRAAINEIAALRTANAQKARELRIVYAFCELIVPVRGDGAMHLDILEELHRAHMQAEHEEAGDRSG